MVTKVEITKALLEEIDEAAQALIDTMNADGWHDDTIHVIVADAFAGFKHLECLMEVLEAVWNKK